MTFFRIRLVLAALFVGVTVNEVVHQVQVAIEESERTRDERGARAPEPERTPASSPAIDPRASAVGDPSAVRGPERRVEDPWEDAEEGWTVGTGARRVHSGDETVPDEGPQPAPVDPPGAGSGPGEFRGIRGGAGSEDGPAARPVDGSPTDGAAGGVVEGEVPTSASPRREIERSPDRPLRTDPPRLALSARPGTTLTARVGEELRLTVVASGVESDRARILLLDPPAGSVFDPPRMDRGTQVRTLRWLIPDRVSGRQHLYFAATSPGTTGRVNLTVTIRVDGPAARTNLVIGDVTGDGLLDVVAGTSWADFGFWIGAKTDVGAIYVWSGSTTPIGTPTACLKVLDSVSGDRLTRSSGQGIQLADVTGDGLLDIVAGATYATISRVTGAGAVYVWAGGSLLAGIVAPTATLSVPGAQPNDWLGNIAGQGVQIEDLTGDGVLDVLAATYVANVGGVADTGAIYVWTGGSTLSGRMPPTATLTVPGARPNDWLGRGSGQGVLLVEVTGDEVLDVVASASYADLGGPYDPCNPIYPAPPWLDAGALYVWAGGRGLAGTVAPTATLTGIPANRGNTRLGDLLGFSAIFHDVSGDGILDVISGSWDGKFEGLYDGVILVWAGGPSLVGSPAPIAALGESVTARCLGNIGSARSVLVDDATGDGVPDVIVGARFAAFGPMLGWGGVYVWAGGPTLVGRPRPTAILRSSDPSRCGFLCDLPLGGQGLDVLDLTGDGVVDVVACSREADARGIQAAGAIYVWAGGPRLAGNCDPSATLSVPGATVGDRLCNTDGQPILFGDVSGDGQIDVVAGTAYANRWPRWLVGAIYVWRGGARLRGQVAPDASLTVPGAADNDRLGVITEAQGFYLADVSGDGKLDVVAGASQADVGGRRDTGALYVWSGGPRLTGRSAPTAALVVPGATPDDCLGEIDAQGLLFADLNGDQVLDVCAGARRADSGTQLGTGAIYVWFGASLAGTTAPHATLSVPGVTHGHALCDIRGGQGLQLSDVSGDGVVDVVAGASNARAPWSATGALYVWIGGASLRGALAPTSRLTVPGAKPTDLLGD